MMPKETNSTCSGYVPTRLAGGPPDELTGLPGFRTWRGVYWFVVGSFVLYVVLLTVFSWAFS